jgi:hypothetical protein
MAGRETPMARRAGIPFQVLELELAPGDLAALTSADTARLTRG